MTFAIYDIAGNAYRDSNENREQLIEDFFDYWKDIAWDSYAENLRGDGNVASDKELEDYFATCDKEEFIIENSFEVVEVEESDLEDANWV
ncbi:TPA: hypothetical protein VBM32_002197 [Streptococcus agalactiae]|nr:hypothetical protein [Streptococcus agalactiae]